MKKTSFFILLVALIAFTFTACKQNDYPAVSQLRKDVLYASSEGYEVTVYPEERETPLISDGTPNENSPVLIVKINSLTEIQGTFTIFAEFDGRRYSATPEQRSNTLMRAVIPVDSLPASTLTICLSGKTETTLTPTSVIPKDTLNHTVALNTAIKNLSDKLIYDGNKPLGEFQVRVLYEAPNAYWYVGYVTERKTYSLLISANGKEIIATREAENV